MSCDTWEEGAASLRESELSATEEQRQLATQLGVELPDVPSLVCGAILREHLASALGLDDRRAPSFGQRDFLAYVSGVDDDEPLEEHFAYCDTKERMSAWIAVELARQAAAALEEIQPKRGDVVSDTLRPEVLGTVVSFGTDGRVYLAGGRNQRIHAHRVNIEARADDRTARADELRARAANLREQLRKTDTVPSAAKLGQLAPFQVDGEPTDEQWRLLSDAIDRAPDEKLIQETLTKFPALLGALVRPSYGTFVLPQVSLGGMRKPDFALVAASSVGLHWTFIELESPRGSLANKDGSPAEKLRVALLQVRQWREWLQANLDFARRARSEQGLGLVDTRPESDAMIFIGRRGSPRNLPPGERQRYIEESRITIHSYDWLLEATRPGARRYERPGGPLDWRDWEQRE